MDGRGQGNIKKKKKIQRGVLRRVGLFKSTRRVTERKKKERKKKVCLKRRKRESELHKALEYGRRKLGKKKNRGD